MVSGETGREGPRFQDLRGIRMVLEDLMMRVIVPLRFPELPRRLGVRRMAGLLLYGPPGCGKAKHVHAIANETGVPFYTISTIDSGVLVHAAQAHRHLSFMLKKWLSFFYFFHETSKLVQPSTKTEGFSSIPNIKWEDVGDLDSMRKAINFYNIQRIKHPEYYERRYYESLSHNFRAA